MEKSAVEEALKGTQLSKLGDPRYFIMLAAFGFYWDSYSHLISGSGLMNLTYTVGDALPLGNTFVLIASFSLLASILSPIIFALCNHLFWDLWFLLPEMFHPGLSTSEWRERLKNSAPKHKLKLWAIQKNSSLAMAMVKEQEESEIEMQKNRPQPFLLALCLGVNYFFVTDGILRIAESRLFSEFHIQFLLGILMCMGALLYLSFTGINDNVGYIYLHGLKEHIDREDG